MTATDLTTRITHLVDHSLSGGGFYIAPTGEVITGQPILRVIDAIRNPYDKVIPSYKLPYSVFTQSSGSTKRVRRAPEISFPTTPWKAADALEQLGYKVIRNTRNSRNAKVTIITKA